MIKPNYFKVIIQLQIGLMTKNFASYELFIPFFDFCFSLVLADEVTKIPEYYVTRNPASRASKRAHLVAMYLAVAIRPSSYVHRVTSEVAVSFLPEVVAQI